MVALYGLRFFNIYELKFCINIFMVKKDEKFSFLKKIQSKNKSHYKKSEAVQTRDIIICISHEEMKVVGLILAAELDS